MPHSHTDLILPVSFYLYCFYPRCWPSLLLPRWNMHHWNLLTTSDFSFQVSYIPHQSLLPAAFVLSHRLPPGVLVNHLWHYLSLFFFTALNIYSQGILKNGAWQSWVCKCFAEDHSVSELLVFRGRVWFICFIPANTGKNMQREIQDISCHKNTYCLLLMICWLNRLPSYILWLSEQCISTIRAFSLLHHKRWLLQSAFVLLRAVTTCKGNLFMAVPSSWRCLFHSRIPWFI